METTLNPSTKPGEVQTALGWLRGQTWGRAAIWYQESGVMPLFPGLKWIFNATDMGREANCSSWLDLTITSATHKKPLEFMFSEPQLERDNKMLGISEIAEGESSNDERR